MSKKDILIKNWELQKRYMKSCRPKLKIKYNSDTKQFTLTDNSNKGV